MQLLDWNIALYCQLEAASLKKLQVVQLNAVASLYQKKYITPAFSKLHWLLINYHTDYTVLRMMFKAQYSLTSAYTIWPKIC